MAAVRVICSGDKSDNKESAGRFAILIVTIVVLSLYGRILNRVVHPFDLPVGPWMVWLGLAMLDLVCGTDHVEPYGPGVRRVAIARLLTKMDAVVY